jgi:thiamine-phosphate pyrophosphorylase
MLVLMTDDARLSDPLAAARLLPKGSMVIVRSRDCKQRAEWAHAMMALSRSSDLLVLVSNDAGLASRCGADGLHLSEETAHLAAHWSALRPRWFISAAAHSLRSAMLRSFVHAIFLSPVFATDSHAGRSPLTAVRANAMARGSTVPVYALGGVTARNAVLLHGFAGIAAIGALAP